MSRTEYLTAGEARAAAAENERWLAAILKNISDAAIMTDKTGRVIMLNQAAEALIGRKQADARGEEITDLIRIVDSETVEPIENPVLKALRKKAEIRLTGANALLMTRNGLKVPVEAVATPLKDEQANFSGIVLIFRHISKESQVEQALAQAALKQESEELFRQMAENINEVVWMTGLDRNQTLYINPAYETIWGRSCQSWHQKPDSWFEAIHPEDRERVMAVLEKEKGGAYDVEFRIIQPNGSVRWIQDRAFPIKNEAGQVYRMVGIATDITERKQHQRELELIVTVAAALRGAPTRAAMLPVILNQLLDLLQMDGAVLEVLDPPSGEAVAEFALGAWEGVVGLRTPPDQGITGHVIATNRPYHNNNVLTDSELYSPDLLNGVPAVACAPLVALQEPIGVLWVGRRGEIKADEVHLFTAIADIAANALHRATLFEDLKTTNQKLTEERILLAKRVAERTAELRAAKAELARAARLKDEFLASMSHELRTPLNGVLGMAEALKEQVYGPLGQRQLHALSRIEESGRHLLDLINDILDLSKIEAGKLELQIGPISPRSVCQASLRLIKQQASKKRLKVSFAFDKTVTTLQADKRRLKQILVNLLSNAVKFTPEGGRIGLEVKGRRRQQVVCFTVWDTGIGISKEDTKRLFKPFVQLDSSLSRHYDGTGLGLALVYRMVKLHGGSVSVESHVGQGSRFTISLPW